MTRFRLAFSILSLLVCHALLHAAEPQYTNPVRAGDYPDPSVIRVGDDYYATATSSEWGPQFPILHSRDLVNWELKGFAFDERPEWAIGNFWAPEIATHNGKFFIYYTGRNKENRLAVAVATADSPTGPYTDHGQLVAQEAGSIDGMAFSDEDGQRWLVWKEDGNSRKQPTPLWLQRLSEDGLKLMGERKEILRNDAEWEGQLVEGPFIFFRDGYYYMLYAGAGCCGRDCNYAVGVARARNVEGPWEKYAGNPILTGNQSWRCPGHGSVVIDPKGNYWFLYHAYAAGTHTTTGREMMLDPITFNAEGWPRVGEGGGPTVRGAAPFGVGSKHVELSFADSFDGDDLKPGWLWPQDREPQMELAGGALKLTAADEARVPIASALIGRSCTSGDYEATTIVDLSQSPAGTLAGIAAVGDAGNAVGLAVGRDRAIVWQNRVRREMQPAEIKFDPIDRIHLRMTARNGSNFQFAFSVDGRNWTPIGESLDGSYMPPWDRSIRIALTVGGVADASARFEEVAIDGTERFAE